MRYKGILEERGKIVESEDAYEYAKAHLDEIPDGDKQMFVEFFFSGNWAGVVYCTIYLGKREGLQNSGFRKNR